MIKVIFGIFCVVLQEIGYVFGVSYETIHIIACNFVEPIFTACMLVLAILALCKVPVRKYAGIFFWAVTGCAALLFIIGAIVALYHYYLIVSAGTFENMMALFGSTPTSPAMQEAFQCTYNCLLSWAQSLHISYRSVNLLLYVILMPALCIASYIITRRKGCCKKGKSKKVK